MGSGTGWMRGLAGRAAGRAGKSRGAALGLALLVAAGVPTAEAGAQQPADDVRVSGIVVDNDTRQPLAAVEVSLVEAERRTTTDAAGRFSFADLRPGRYTLRFERLGYGERTEIVDLGVGAAATREFVLEARAIPLAPLRVRSDRTGLVGDPGALARIPGTAHYLSTEELNRQKLAFDDVHQLLRQIPGMNIREEDGYGLRPNIGIRGTGAERSSRITLMEDGVLAAPAPYAAPAAYYFPVAGRMDAIEVRKGSSQIEFGPRTTGGALNLISSAIPQENSATVDASGGSEATGKLRATAGGTYGRVGALLQTYQLRTDGYKRLDAGGPTGFTLEDYLLKARIAAEPGSALHQELEIKLGWTDEVSRETYLGLTDADFASDPLRRYAASAEDVMRAEHRQAQARYFARHESGLDFTATVYRNDFARNWYKLGSVGGVGIADVVGDPAGHAAELAILRGEASGPDALTVRANNREYVSRGVQTVVGANLARGALTHAVELGVRYHEDREDRFQHEDGYRMAGGSMERTSGGEPGSQSNRVSDAAAWSFFVQDQIRFGDWTVAPGLRYETIGFTRRDYAGGDADRGSPTRTRENDVSVLIPGIGATGTLSPGLTVFGGVHKGFAPPGPGADDRTRAEQGVNYELGARYYRGPLGLQAVAYFNDYDNVLGRATLASGESGAGELFNGGAVDVKGLEVAAAYDLLHSSAGELRAPVRLSYTLTDAVFRSAFESAFGPWGTVEERDALPYVPDHQLHVELGAERDAWRVTLSGDYTSVMRTIASQGPIPEGQATDGGLVLNLAGEYDIAAWGTLYAGVQNLVDRHYIVSRLPAGARPGLPRTLNAGVRLRW